MERRFLLDASSVVQALKLGNLRVIYGNYIQWLTVYEVVNALWKEALLAGSISVEEASNLVEVFAETVKLVEVLSPHPYEAEILETAAKLGLTAYDASYVVLAIRNGLSLVTEDRVLREKAKGVVKAVSLREVL
ncbi:type II toxin-antitoxin system VapC family toxin [Thermofilum pendens]|uniref:PIN domain-containing protein n=1 Tax=Thermofilum pendens (strain DSM 2475 / Hrk 5) TaxID=368408 RepID=A1S053_THEPD|nr:type II toxin-antitoxin system VapC family toxin [Thermofilum pendens]ABL78833.1 conserved hypothetical protein [Thermofilum pendens Hrk 5]